MVISLRPGMEMSREELCRRLVNLQYERNDVNFVRNKFRVRGDTVDIYLAYMSELAIKVEFFGDEIDRITEFQSRHRRPAERRQACGHLPGQPLYRQRREEGRRIEKIRGRMRQPGQGSSPPRAS